MFAWMVLLFTVLPALEIWVFFQIPMSLGAKLLVVLFTGIAGASLARAQGLRVIADIQGQLANSAMPTQELLEGGIVLFGGALLLTPGFLTDTVGFLCLLPPSRKLIALGLTKWFAGRVQVAGATGFQASAGGFRAAHFEVRGGGMRPPKPPPERAPEPIGAPGRVDMGAHAGPRVAAPKTIEASFSVVDDED